MKLYPEHTPELRNPYQEFPNLHSFLSNIMGDDYREYSLTGKKGTAQKIKLSDILHRYSGTEARKEAAKSLFIETFSRYYLASKCIKTSVKHSHVIEDVDLVSLCEQLDQYYEDNLQGANGSEYFYHGLNEANYLMKQKHCERKRSQFLLIEDEKIARDIRLSIADVVKKDEMYHIQFLVESEMMCENDILELSSIDLIVSFLGEQKAILINPVFKRAIDKEIEFWSVIESRLR